MAWRVQGRRDPGRWVEHDGSRWTADPDTWAQVWSRLSGPVMLPPTGPAYIPDGPEDPVAVYVAAMAVVPAPVVTGQPPAVPVRPRRRDSGVIY